MSLGAWMKRIRNLIPQTTAARHTRRQPPLVFQWHAEPGRRTLPMRRVEPLRPLPTPVMMGLVPVPFDFTSHMTRLCQHIIEHTPDLMHIDLSRVLVTITRAKTRRNTGLQAKVTPMRFKHGHLTQKRRGWVYQVQQYYVNQVEMLYLLSFCLPRFQNLPYEEKLITIFHELFHISPEFNGDLRRHEGRYYQHSHSKKKYDLLMQSYVEKYLQSYHDASLTAFLHCSFEELHERHGSVHGVMVPVPKLVPLLG
jgi:predicted metallopeptidase